MRFFVFFLILVSLTACGEKDVPSICKFEEDAKTFTTNNGTRVTVHSMLELDQAGAESWIRDSKYSLLCQDLSSHYCGLAGLQDCTCGAESDCEEEEEAQICTYDCNITQVYCLVHSGSIVNDDGPDTVNSAGYDSPDADSEPSGRQQNSGGSSSGEPDWDVVEGNKPDVTIVECGDCDRRDANQLIRSTQNPYYCPCPHLADGYCDDFKSRYGYGGCACGIHTENCEQDAQCSITCRIKAVFCVAYDLQTQEE